MISDQGGVGCSLQPTQRYTQLSTSEFFIISKATGVPIHADFYSVEKENRELPNRQVLFKKEIQGSELNKQLLRFFLNIPTEEIPDTHETVWFWIGLEAEQNFKKGFKLWKFNHQAKIEDEFDLQGQDDFIQRLFESMEGGIYFQLRWEVMNVMEEEELTIDETTDLPNENQVYDFKIWITQMMKEVLTESFRAGFKLAQIQPNFDFCDGPVPFDVEAVFQQTIPLNIIMKKFDSD